MLKKVFKKNTKKNGKFFFNTLFYFSKMDKNKCPKKFLKKKFQKTGDLLLFLFFSNRQLSISPKVYDLYGLCIYLSVSLVLQMKTKNKS